MTALLAPFLIRFSSPPPELALASRTEPDLAISPADLAARIAAAVADARDEAEHRHVAAIAAITATHATDSVERLEAARAEWTAVEGETLAARLDAGLADLRAYLVDRVAAALRPLIAEALRDRLKDDVLETIDRLLADPGVPMLSVRGPAELLEALRAARPEQTIEWVADDNIDVSIAAGATRAEGRFTEALKALVGKEA